jgi:hypothetical protein
MSQIFLGIDGELVKLAHHSAHASHFQYPDLFPWHAHLSSIHRSVLLIHIF